MSRVCYIKISLVVSSDVATLLGTNVVSLIQALFKGVNTVKPTIPDLTTLVKQTRQKLQSPCVTIINSQAM